MKIAIIGAMQKEIDYLLAHLENRCETKRLKHVFYEGNFAGKELVIVKSGIGKVASGILFSALVNSYPDLDLVINIGVSGGVVGKVASGEVVVAGSVAYGDVDVRVGGDYSYGQIPDCPAFFPSQAEIITGLKLSLPYKEGIILSGDRFYSDQEEVAVLALDMESAAFGQSAWFYDIPFIAIRAISDLIGRKSQYQEYCDYLETACINSNLFLLEVLKHLN
jgi:adenosylhomocysteine nucleosidase